MGVPLRGMDVKLGKPSARAKIAEPKKAVPSKKATKPNQRKSVSIQGQSGGLQ